MRFRLSALVVLFIAFPLWAQVLTSGQQQTLATDIGNNTNTIGGVQIKDMTHTADNAFAVAQFYNQQTAYLVWNKSVSKQVVDAAINKAVYTPTDAAPASTNTIQGTNDALLYNNRALLIQLKQTNAQWITAGQGTIDSSTTQLRQNFSDCMTGIPSGVSGASQNAGWGTAGTPGAVRLVMMRTARTVEKLFVATATGPGNDGVAGNRGTNTNPDATGFDGSITDTDVRLAWGI